MPSSAYLTTRFFEAVILSFAALTILLNCKAIVSQNSFQMQNPYLWKTICMLLCRSVIRWDHRNHSWLINVAVVDVL
ncbi:hypothetical protein AB4K20DRAFT_1904063, partial [Rhizopus microsporus]